MSWARRSSSGTSCTPHPSHQARSTRRRREWRRRSATSARRSSPAPGGWCGSGLCRQARAVHRAASRTRRAADRRGDRRAVGVADRRHARLRPRRAPGGADRVRPGGAAGRPPGPGARDAAAPRGDRSRPAPRTSSRSGALAAQPVRAIIAVHLQHQLPAGTVAAALGTVNAATDDFEIRVHGHRRARRLPPARRRPGRRAVPGGRCAAADRQPAL